MDKVECEFTSAWSDTDVDICQTNLNKRQSLLSRKDGGKDMKDDSVDNMGESSRTTGVDTPREKKLRDGGEMLNHGVSDNNNLDNPRSSHNKF